MTSLKSNYYHPTISDQQESLWKIQKNINRISLKKLLLLLLDRIKIQEKRKNWSPSTFDSNENGKIIKKKKKYPLEQKRSYSSHDLLVNSPQGEGGGRPLSRATAWQTLITRENRESAEIKHGIADFLYQPKLPSLSKNYFAAACFNPRRGG